MSFDLSLESMLMRLNKLQSDTSPQWGNMSAQQMVEHLSEMLRMSTGKIQLPLEIEESKIERMQDFLRSDKPMAKNIKVAFVSEQPKLRNEELELAIDEFVEEWLFFEETYADHPNFTALHPYYGELNEELWRLLHAKHFEHHFEQFGI